MSELRLGRRLRVDGGRRDRTRARCPVGNSGRESECRGCSSSASGSVSRRRSSRPATRSRHSRRRRPRSPRQVTRSRRTATSTRTSSSCRSTRRVTVIRRSADAIEGVVGARPRGMRFPPWAVAGRALRHAARRGLHLLLVGDGRRASALGAVLRASSGTTGRTRPGRRSGSSRFRSRSSRATSRTSSSTATGGRRCPQGSEIRATSSRSGSTSSPTTPIATPARSRCSCFIRRRSAGADA